MNDRVNKIVSAAWFERAIIGFILINGVILGMETSPALVNQYGALMHLGNHLILGIFILEAMLKMLAVAPQVQRYFQDGWNVFDFSVIVFSLIPATGDFAMIARLARLLRVVRLISTIPELRLIVSTLVRSIPSMIYAIMGYQLFHEHDPTHWRSLGISLLTLFRVVTLEDWTDVMYTAMEFHYLSWLYFVSFVILGTFVVINLFIAVVINNLDEAKAERLAELQGPVTQKEILKDLRETQKALKRLEARLERTS